MKKLFSLFGSAVSKVGLTALMIATAGAAYAADPVPITQVNQALQGGITYSYPQYQPVAAMYVPVADGTLRIEGFQDFAMYKECITPGVKYDKLYDTEFIGYFPYTRTITVTKDVPVYIYEVMPMNDTQGTLYLEGVDVAPLKIQYMQPDTSKPVDFNNYPGMQVTFDHKVSTDDTNAIISFQNRLTNQKEEIISRASVSGTVVSVPFYGILKPYIASGAINPKDEFTVTVKGIVGSDGQTCVDAAEDGSLTFTFLCGSIPTVATEKFCPDPFLSYWPEGTKEGILKITFDKPLGDSPKNRATLGWGNLEGEDGEYYFEEIPATVDGNVLTVDFTGKLRTPATMTPLYPNASYPTIAVQVFAVDEFEQPVGSEGQGTVGSYSFMPAYKMVERTSIAADFEPAAGADLADAAKVSVWISGTKGMQFDGFKIDAVNKSDGKAFSAVVPMSDVTISEKEEDSANYTFNMPKDVLDNASSAVVTLNNLVTFDGYDHSNDIRATYGGFVVTYSDPANGASIALLKEGDTIKIETNLAEKNPNMYIEYEIICLNPNEGYDPIVKTSVWLTRQEDGSYESEIFGNYKLIQGKEYKVLFSAWKDETTRNINPEETLGSDFIIWKGATPPYIYSSINLTGITPEDESVLTVNDTKLTVTFDGGVNLGKTSGSDIETGMKADFGPVLMPFEKVTPVQPYVVDGTTYATIWELEFPADFIATKETPFFLSMKAYDELGRLVKGNEGEDEGTYFVYNYYPAGMYKELEISLGEEPLSSVSEITISYSTDINVSYDFPYSDVVVYDKSFTPVAVMADYRPIFDSDDLEAHCTSGKIVLDKPVNTEGTYMLVIPRGFFNLSTEFSSLKNDAVQYKFEIGEGGGGDQPGPDPATVNVSVEPAPGVVTSIPATIEITFEDCSEIALGSGKPTLTIDGGQPIELDDAVYDDIVWNRVSQSLGKEYTEPGTYVISYPNGYFNDQNGDPVGAFSLTYVIKGGEPAPAVNVTTDPAQGTVTVLPASIDLIFNDYKEIAIGSGFPSLSINGAAPVKLPDAELDWDIYNKAIQHLDQEYTADGTYVISYPQGYFLDQSGNPVPAFSLTYVIGDPTGVQIVDIEANDYTVYTLTGVRILNHADRDAFKALAPGLYIVNGFKVVVK